MNNKHTSPEEREDALNRDPITGTPGSHPVGTGLGAAGGGAAGALAGATLGPAGAVAGAVIGAVVGGLAGKGVAESVNPTIEEAYWRDAYEREAYYQAGYNYDDYSPAYQAGYDARARHAGKRFEDVEADIQADYNRRRGSSRLSWDHAKPATRAAWDRIERALPGDADGDGK